LNSKAFPGPALHQRLLASALSSPGSLLAVVAYGVFLVWLPLGGAFEQTVWYPGALLVLAALTALFLVNGARLRLPRTMLVAVGALAVFTGWCFLSIVWADVQGDAWDGANRTLLYLTVYSLFAFVSLTPRMASLLLGGFAVGVAVVLGIELVRAVRAVDPSPFFIEGRFDAPTGYANANAAVAMVAAWPGLYLASRRETPWQLRGVLLAAACLLTEAAVLAQSRAMFLVTPLAVILYLVLVRERARSLLMLGLVAGAVAASMPLLLAVHGERGSPSSFEASIHDCVLAIVVSCSALFVIGSLLGLLDRRLNLAPAAARLLGRIAAVIAVVAVVGGIGAGVALVGNPVDRVSEAWRQFKERPDPTEAGETLRLVGGFGSYRYDYWRVALGEFTEAPLVGVGVDNFAVDYLRERRGPEEPLYPHSGVLRVLSQTGIVGSVFFVVFLGAGLIAAYHAIRGACVFRAGLAGAATVSFGYFFLHGAGDWLWEFPGVAAPAFAALAIAGRLGESVVEVRSPIPRILRHWRAVVITLTITGVLLAAASYVPPWLAEREIANAARIWGVDPEGAYTRLDRARNLNFLSERPDLVAGTIASRRGEWQQMRTSFKRALERNETSFYAALELGIAEELLGNRPSAVASLQKAQRLNPRDPLPAAVMAELRSGRPVSPELVDRAFLERAEQFSGEELE
jgi:O-antigen ligase